MTDRIGVLVVEREALFRRGLAGCLEADPVLRLVASVATAEEGYRHAADLLPDVALVGTALPDAPGVAAAAELRRRTPAVATVVLAIAESNEELFAAIRAGAHAYVGRDVPEDELIALIRRVAAGDFVINEQLLANASVAGRVLEQFRAVTASPLAPANAFSPLTEREMEILKRVSDGMTNAEIGFVLGISSQTVKNHVTSILRKLAVNDRTQAVVKALRRGWLPIDESEAIEAGNGTGPTNLEPADERRSRV